MKDESPSGCLFAIFRALGVGGTSNRPAEVALPYRRRDYLFSKAEASFFGVLNKVVGQDYLIFAKVRLADLLYLPRGTQGRQSAFNRIQSKHVDFVLCHPNGTRPCLAIELDDSSHGEPERVERDAFVKAALTAASLPLLQVKASGSYNTQELAERIRSALQSAA